MFDLFHFRNLLANLDVISGRSKHLSNPLETSWKTARSLIGDIRTELVKHDQPTPLTVGSKPSPLLAFIQLEAHSLSQQIDIASSFIDDLEQVLIGQAAAPAFACDALKAIATRRMPQLGIKNTSSPRRDLTQWIRDLQQRLMKLPSGDEVGFVFEMSVFSHPESFLDAAVRHLARQQYRSLHSVYLAADLSVRTASDSFKCKLKTYLFNITFNQLLS